MSIPIHHDTPVADLALPAPFPENQSPADAPRYALPEPNDGYTLLALALPVPERPEWRPRILFVDDDELLLNALQISAGSWFAGALDVRCWAPRLGELLVQLQCWRSCEGWRPDLLVLDINFSERGKGGIDYLRELRAAPGWKALPVVLATGNLLRDLDQDRVSDPLRPNRTGTTPKEWLRQAKQHAPEAILYGKTGSADFLRRVGESLPVWRDTARRRAWSSLLAAVARKLDGPFRDDAGSAPNAVGQEAWSSEQLGDQVAGYLHDELAVDQVYVRWHNSGDRYGLVGARAPAEAGRRIGHVLDVREVPFLDAITRGQGQALLRNDGLRPDETGSMRPHIVGRKFLGAGAVLDGECVAFLSLLREPGAEDFDARIDAEQLELLAALLASAGGRARRVWRMRERETHLLGFAQALSSATTEDEIAQRLAELLHEVLHPGNHPSDHQEAVVIVRLVDFNTGEIRRVAEAGRPSRGVQIWLWTEASMFRRTVDTGGTHHIHDADDSAEGAQRVDTSTPPGYMRCEMCVPLKVGPVAIGAVSCEHHQPQRYSEDRGEQRFVESAASVASASIMRLRARVFMMRIARLASDFARLKADELRGQLTEIVKAFSGASVAVWLSRPPQAYLPWAVEDIEVQLGQVDGDGAAPGGERLRKALASIYVDQWASTKVGQWAAQEAWADRAVSFSNSGGVPAQWQAGLTGHTGQTGAAASTYTLDQSVAVLWCRPDPLAAPARALVLLWWLAPPLGASDLELLTLLTELWSTLEARKHEVETLERRNMLGEQAAALGHVMQHFRHRLRSDLGAFTGLAELMDAAVESGDLARLGALVGRFKAGIRKVGAGFHKSVGYIKDPERSRFALREVIDAAWADLSGHPVAVGCRIDVKVPVGMDCDWDRDILELCLFTLIENALDALAGQPDPCIAIDARQDAAGCRIRVGDNGPGVEADKAQRLFHFGFTTKSNSLGSALAFARVRMEVLGGGVRWVDPADPIDACHGAEFELFLPFRTYAEPTNPPAP